MIDAPTADQLWLVEYCEPRANDLCVTLIEAKTGKEAIDTELGTAFPVRPDQRSRVFRVTWFNYVAFLVRNESYATPDSDTPRGCGLGKLERSPFREYVAATTFASDDYPGPLTHWYLTTEWHCFDVIAADDPEIAQLDAAEASLIISRYA